MKKIFFSLLAIAAIASCAKTEPVYVEDNSEIKLAPVTTHVTKADVLGSIDGTQYPAAEEFDVYAYWATDGAGSVFTTGATAYLGDPTKGAGVEFTKKGDWFWGGTTPYYWPKNGSLRFAAYSPASIEQAVKHDLAYDTYTVTGYTQPSTTDKTFDFLLAPTSVSYTAATAVDDVDVVFEHALSWITLQAKAADETAADAFTVHSVQIDKVNTVADLTAAMPAKTWSNWSTPVDYAVGPTTDVTLGTDIVVLDKVANGTVIIPQATTTVTINYTQNSVNGSAQLDNQTVTVPLLLDGENTPWEPGKHYIYTIIFGLDEILITPSVVDWEDVEVPVIDATATEVANAEELISAVAQGRNVRLTSNIALEEPAIVKSGDVLLELNGYTITGGKEYVSGMTGTDISVIVVDGGNLTINGAGKVVANSFYAVYAKSGNLTIEGGEYSAITSAVQVSNSVVNIKGGKFENTSDDKRYTINCLDADYKNGEAVVNVAGGSFVAFNPANNPSEGVGTNYVVNGYNVVNENEVYTVYPSEGANIVLGGATTFVSTVNVKNGTFDGAGNELSVKDAPENTASAYGIVCPEGDVTISNVTINGNNNKTTNGKGLRAIYITKAGNYVVDHVVAKGVVYPINVNTTKPVTLTVKNSELEGWTSYGGSTTASFDNVKFTCGEYANFKPYSNVTLTGCSFAKGFMIDFSALDGIITFINCTYDGTVLTAENFEATVGTDYLDSYAADKVAF